MIIHFVEIANYENIRMSRILIALFISFCLRKNPLAHEEPYCLDCSLVDCLPEIKPDDCPEGYFYKKNTFFGCCPSCVKYLDTGDDCDIKEWGVQRILSDTVEAECGGGRRVLKKEYVPARNYEDVLIPATHIIECKPESKCVKGKCTLRGDRPCSQHLLRYKKWLEDKDCATYEWEPRCTEFGYYSSVQSKSNIHHNTRNFCSDVNGKRIFGSMGYQEEKPTKSCICSRKMDEIINVSKKESMTLHCTTTGEYESLQCDNGLCWCMNLSQPTYGASTVVPESLIKVLPCYDGTTVGKSYLRRCESRRIGKIKSKSILRQHGHFWRELYNDNCGFDGSFDIIHCMAEPNTRCNCVSPNGKLIKSYYADALLNLDCLCAREEYEGLTNNECDNNGGYKELQRGHGDEWCVDKDGYQWSMSVMQRPGQNNERCLIPNCKSSEIMCETNQCRNCSECSKCSRNPGESCFSNSVSSSFFI